METMMNSGAGHAGAAAATMMRYLSTNSSSEEACPYGFVIPEDPSDPDTIFVNGTSCAYGCMFSLLFPETSYAYSDEATDIAIAGVILAILMLLVFIVDGHVGKNYLVVWMGFGSLVFSASVVAVGFTPQDERFCRNNANPLTQEDGATTCAAQSVIALYFGLVTLFSWLLICFDMCHKAIFGLRTTAYFRIHLGIVFLVPVIPLVLLVVNEQIGHARGGVPLCLTVNDFYLERDGGWKVGIILILILLFIGLLAIMVVIYITLRDIVRTYYLLQKERDFDSIKRSLKASPMLPNFIVTYSPANHGSPFGTMHACSPQKGIGKVRRKSDASFEPLAKFHEHSSESKHHELDHDDKLFLRKPSGSTRRNADASQKFNFMNDDNGQHRHRLERFSFFELPTYSPTRTSMDQRKSPGSHMQKSLKSLVSHSHKRLTKHTLPPLRLSSARPTGAATVRQQTNSGPLASDLLSTAFASARIASNAPHSVRAKHSHMRLSSTALAALNTSRTPTHHQHLVKFSARSGLSVTSENEHAWQKGTFIPTSTRVDEEDQDELDSSADPTQSLRLDKEKDLSEDLIVPVGDVSEIDGIETKPVSSNASGQAETHAKGREDESTRRLVVSSRIDDIVPSADNVDEVGSERSGLGSLAPTARAGACSVAANSVSRPCVPSAKGSRSARLESFRGSRRGAGGKHYSLEPYSREDQSGRDPFSFIGNLFSGRRGGHESARVDALMESARIDAPMQSMRTDLPMQSATMDASMQPSSLQQDHYHNSSNAHFLEAMVTAGRSRQHSIILQDMYMEELLQEEKQWEHTKEKLRSLIAPLAFLAACLVFLLPWTIAFSHGMIVSQHYADDLPAYTQCVFENFIPGDTSQTGEYFRNICGPETLRNFSSLEKLSGMVNILVIIAAAQSILLMIPFSGFLLTCCLQRLLILAHRNGWHGLFRMVMWCVEVSNWLWEMLLSCLRAMLIGILFIRRMCFCCSEAKTGQVHPGETSQRGVGAMVLSEPPRTNHPDLFLRISARDAHSSRNNMCEGAGAVSERETFLNQSLRIVRNKSPLKVRTSGKAGIYLWNSGPPSGSASRRRQVPLSPHASSSNAFDVEMTCYGGANASWRRDSNNQVIDGGSGGAGRGNFSWFKKKRRPSFSIFNLQSSRKDELKSEESKCSPLDPPAKNLTTTCLGDCAQNSSCASIFVREDTVDDDVDHTVSRIDVCLTPQRSQCTEPGASDHNTNIPADSRSSDTNTNTTGCRSK